MRDRHSDTPMQTPDDAKQEIARVIVWAERQGFENIAAALTQARAVLRDR